MDRARQKTDKRLKEMEREIGRIYENNPALKNIQKEYLKYMAAVNKKTKKAYLEYKNADGQEEKRLLKQAYIDQVKALTVESVEYNKLMRRYAMALSEVNAQALEYINDNVDAIYVDNYNDIATECKKMGIKVV